MKWQGGEDVDVSGSDILCGVCKVVRWLFDAVTFDFMGGTTAIWLMGPLKSLCDVTPLMTVLLDVVEAAENDSPTRERFLVFVW